MTSNIQPLSGEALTLFNEVLGKQPVSSAKLFLLELAKDPNELADFMQRLTRAIESWQTRDKETRGDSSEVVDSGGIIPVPRDDLARFFNEALSPKQKSILKDMTSQIDVSSLEIPLEQEQADDLRARVAGGNVAGVVRDPALAAKGGRGFLHRAVVERALFPFALSAGVAAAGAAGVGYAKDAQTTQISGENNPDSAWRKIASGCCGVPLLLIGIISSIFTAKYIRLPSGPEEYTKHVAEFTDGLNLMLDQYNRAQDQGPRK